MPGVTASDGPTRTADRFDPADVRFGHLRTPEGNRVGWTGGAVCYPRYRDVMAAHDRESESKPRVTNRAHVFTTRAAR